MLAFHADRLVADFLRLLGDIVGQRLHVPVRRSAGDDHVVRYGGHVLNIELRDVLRLDVVERVDDQGAQLLAVHAWFSLIIKLTLLLFTSSSENS